METAIASLPGRVGTDTAKFIKLGENGQWERLCIEDGTLRLAYYDVPHDLALSGNKEGIRDVYLKLGFAPRTASDYARQVLEFYQEPPETIWITFHQGFLWWCHAKSGVEFLGQDKDEHPVGSRLRRTVAGWHNMSIGGQPLRLRELNGRLTRTVGFQGAICNVSARDYLLARINDDELPVITEANAAKANTLATITSLIQHLTWQDFELLVELIFAQSGWRRVGEIGGTQRTVDIELELPSTGEHAFVQVKSATRQRELDDYVNRMDESPDARMFYAYHTTTGPLATNNPRVSLIGPERLSELALDAGLFTWLIEKIR